MKKLLPYILILAISVVYVLQSNQYAQHVGITKGYLQQFHVLKGEHLIGRLYSSSYSKHSIIRIYDIDGNAVDSTIQKMKRTNSDTNEIRFCYDVSHLHAGVYLIENMFTFLVSERKSTKPIVFVYPFLTLQAISNYDNESFSFYASTGKKLTYELSTERPIQTDAVSKNLLHWLQIKYPNQVEVIADYMIDRIELNNALYIVGNNNNYITGYHRRFLQKEIQHGKNLLCFGSSNMNIIIRYLPTKNKMVRYPEPSIDPEKRRFYKTGLASSRVFQNDNFSFIGIDCYYPNKIENGLPIDAFRFIENTEIPELNGLQLTMKNNISFGSAPIRNGKYDLSRFSKYHTYKILAEGMHITNEKNVQVGNIVLLQKEKSSGKQLTVGTLSWLEKENLEQPAISRSTKRMIDYLLTASE